MPTIRSVTVSCSASGDNQVIAGVAGVSHAVVAFRLSFSGTVNAKFTDGPAGTVLDGPYYGTAGCLVPGDALPVTRQGTPEQWRTSAGNALTLNLSAGTAVTATVFYIDVQV